MKWALESRLDNKEDLVEAIHEFLPDYPFYDEYEYVYNQWRDSVSENIEESARELGIELPEEWYYDCEGVFEGYDVRLWTENGTIYGCVYYDDGIYTSAGVNIDGISEQLGLEGTQLEETIRENQNDGIYEVGSLSDMFENLAGYMYYKFIEK